MPPEGASAEQNRVLELVLRHGAGTNSFASAQSGFQYFFHGAEACVAYVDTGHAWVTAGAPIAAREAQPEVVAAFLAAARAAGKRVSFFGVEQALSLPDGRALRVLGIGEEPVWDPRAWHSVLRGHRSLREQLRRARAKGVSARELPASELERAQMRDQLSSVTERWLATRAMAPMGFLVRVELFAFSAQRRTFVAEQAGRVLGFANVVPVPARGGWFLQDLVRAPDAPNGTGELLVNAVMRWASDNGCPWLTLGLAPLSGVAAPWLARARRYTRWLYDFSGLRAYKAKFRPNSWHPAYLCFPQNQHALRSIIDVLSAFAQGGFLSFGLRTLRRRPARALHAVSATLVPWTLLGPLWTVLAAAAYASGGSLAAALNRSTSAFTSRSKSVPRAIGS